MRCLQAVWAQQPVEHKVTVVFSPQSGVLYTGDEKGSIIKWLFSAYYQENQQGGVSGIKRSPSAASISPDAELGSIKEIWPSLLMHGHKAPIKLITYCSNDHQDGPILSLDADGVCCVWEQHSSTCVHQKLVPQLKGCDDVHALPLGGDGFICLVATGLDLAVPIFERPKTPSGISHDNYNNRFLARSTSLTNPSTPKQSIIENASKSQRGSQSTNKPSVVFVGGIEFEVDTDEDSGRYDSGLNQNVSNISSDQIPENPEKSANNILNDINQLMDRYVSEDRQGWEIIGKKTNNQILEPNIFVHVLDWIQLEVVKRVSPILEKCIFNIDKFQEPSFERKILKILPYTLSLFDDQFLEGQDSSPLQPQYSISELSQLSYNFMGGDLPDNLCIVGWLNDGCYSVFSISLEESTLNQLFQPESEDESGGNTISSLKFWGNCAWKEPIERIEFLESHDMMLTIRKNSFHLLRPIEFHPQFKYGTKFTVLTYSTINNGSIFVQKELNPVVKQVSFRREKVPRQARTYSNYEPSESSLSDINFLNSCRDVEFDFLEGGFLLPSQTTTSLQESARLILWDKNGKIIQFKCNVNQNGQDTVQTQFHFAVVPAYPVLNEFCVQNVWCIPMGNSKLVRVICDKLTQNLENPSQQMNPNYANTQVCIFGTGSVPQGTVDIPPSVTGQLSDPWRPEDHVVALQKFKTIAKSNIQEFERVPSRLSNAGSFKSMIPHRRASFEVVLRSTIEDANPETNQSDVGKFTTKCVIIGGDDVCPLIIVYGTSTGQIQFVNLALCGKPSYHSDPESRDFQRGKVVVQGHFGGVSFLKELRMQNAVDPNAIRQPLQNIQNVRFADSDPENTQKQLMNINILISGGEDGSVRGWDLRLENIGQSLFVVHPHTAPIIDLILPPQFGIRKYLFSVITVDEEGGLALISLEKNRCDKVMSGHIDGPPQEIAWNGVKGYLGVRVGGQGRGKGKERIVFWDLQSGMRDRVVVGENGEKLFLDFQKQCEDLKKADGKDSDWSGVRESLHLDGLVKPFDCPLDLVVMLDVDILGLLRQVCENEGDLMGVRSLAVALSLMHRWGLDIDCDKATVRMLNSIGLCDDISNEVENSVNLQHNICYVQGGLVTKQGVWCVQLPMPLARKMDLKKTKQNYQEQQALKNKVKSKLSHAASSDTLSSGVLSERALHQQNSNYSLEQAQQGIIDQIQVPTPEMMNSALPVPSSQRPLLSKLSVDTEVSFRDAIEQQQVQIQSGEPGGPVALGRISTASSFSLAPFEAQQSQFQQVTSVSFNAQLEQVPFNMPTPGFQSLRRDSVSTSQRSVPSAQMEEQDDEKFFAEEYEDMNREEIEAEEEAVARSLGNPTLSNASFATVPGALQSYNSFGITLYDDWELSYHPANVLGELWQKGSDFLSSQVLAIVALSKRVMIAANTEATCNFCSAIVTLYAIRLKHISTLLAPHALELYAALYNDANDHLKEAARVLAAAATDPQLEDQNSVDGSFPPEVTAIIQLWNAGNSHGLTEEQVRTNALQVLVSGAAILSHCKLAPELLLQATIPSLVTLALTAPMKYAAGAAQMLAEGLNSPDGARYVTHLPSAQITLIMKNLFGVLENLFKGEESKRLDALKRSESEKQQSMARKQFSNIRRSITSIGMTKKSRRMSMQSLWMLTRSRIKRITPQQDVLTQVGTLTSQLATPTDQGRIKDSLITLLTSMASHNLQAFLHLLGHRFTGGASYESATQLTGIMILVSLLHSRNGARLVYRHLPLFCSVIMRVLDPSHSPLRAQGERAIMALVNQLTMRFSVIEHHIASLQMAVGTPETIATTAPAKDDTDSQTEPYAVLVYDLSTGNPTKVLSWGSNEPTNKSFAQRLLQIGSQSSKNKSNQDGVENKVQQLGASVVGFSPEGTKLVAYSHGAGCFGVWDLKSKWLSGTGKTLRGVPVLPPVRVVKTGIVNLRQQNLGFKGSGDLKILWSTNSTVGLHFEDKVVITVQIPE